MTEPNQDQGPPGFPDKVAYVEDGWAVRFQGCIQASRWNDRGPALAALELLQSGHMKPDPEPIGKTKHDFRWEIDPKYPPVQVDETLAPGGYLPVKPTDPND